MGIIKCGKDTPISQGMGTVPDVSGALNDYYQKIQFTEITKAVVNFQAQETPQNFNFMGQITPLNGKQLMLKPEGQRGWNWLSVRAQTQLPLDIDDTLVYLGTQYRVMTIIPWNLYGYYEYHIQSDYQGVSP